MPAPLSGLLEMIEEVLFLLLRNISGGLSGLQNLTSRMRDKYPLSIPKSGLIEQDYALALNDPGGRANPRDLSVDLLKKIEKCAI